MGFFLCISGVEEYARSLKDCIGSPWCIVFASVLSFLGLQGLIKKFYVFMFAPPPLKTPRLWSPSTFGTRVLYHICLSQKNLFPFDTFPWILPHHSFFCFCYIMLWLNRKHIPDNGVMISLFPGFVKKCRDLKKTHEANSYKERVVRVQSSLCGIEVLLCLLGKTNTFQLHEIRSCITVTQTNVCTHFSFNGKSKYGISLRVTCSLA